MDSYKTLGREYNVKWDAGIIVVTHKITYNATMLEGCIKS
jgi:hypothetical protein